MSKWLRELLIGLAILVGGALLSGVSWWIVGPGGTYVIFVGAFLYGGFRIIRSAYWLAVEGPSDAGRERRRTRGKFKYRCRECGRLSVDQNEAMEHAELAHGAMSFADMEATWERVKGLPPAPTHRCTLCGAEFGDFDDALAHLAASHPDARMRTALTSV